MSFEVDWVEFRRSHQGHHIHFEPVCDLHNGMISCVNCGAVLVATKVPAEFVRFTFDLDEKSKCES
jgi:hypothetical protein